MKSDLSKYFKSSPHLLISSHANIEYLTGYSGFSALERECFLLISKNKSYLITDGRYSEAVAKIATDFEVVNLGASRFINQKSELTSGIKKIGIEEYDLTVTEFKCLNKLIGKTVGIDLSDLRLIKTQDELSKIKKAALISDRAFEHVLKKLKVGVSEKEISDEIENFYKKSGVDISFDPIVAFGPHSSIPHHVPSPTKLKNNSIVLLDFGAKVDGYCSDMTRTVFFGKADREFKKMHEAVLNAQKTAFEKTKSGANAKYIDEAARKYLIKNGYPSIPHSVGHGIGLEVHESPHISPYSKDKIKPGMIFSVEPGVYLPGIGGVRIEDLVTLIDGKPQLISRARRNIIEV